MGDIVSFGDSIVITIFSMIVVFVVLLAIAYIIEILRVTANGKKDKEEPKEANIVQEEATKEEVDHEELIAVIAAAVAANLGANIPEIKIRTIRRIPSNNPLWSEAGRREQILERL